jgi:hypothetical protein
MADLISSRARSPSFLFAVVPKKKVAVRKTVNISKLYRGADKSLARPGRKQATVTEDFDVHISYL